VPFTARMCYCFYAPSALLAFCSICGFCFYEPNPARRRNIFLGVIGGVFGLADLIWPSLVFEGQFFGLLRSVSDSFLYVPLVLEAVMAIDERLAEQLDAPAVTGYAGSAAHSAVLRGRTVLARPSSGVEKLSEVDRMRRLRRTGYLFATLFLCVLAHPRLYDVVAGGQLCFYPEEWETSASLCEKGAEYLNQVDSHTRTLYRVLRNFASSRNMTRPTGEVVGIPTEMYGSRPLKTLFYGSQIPTWDEDMPGTWLKRFMSSVIFDYLRTGLLNPLQDVHVDFASAAEAHQLFELAARPELKVLELTPWQEMRSDKAISRFAFAGLAAHRTQRIGDGKGKVAYKNDWTWLYDLEVRPGFERYGAAAYFSEDAELVKIFWSHGDREVYPNDHEWEHAKWAYKCSVIAGVTLKDHLVGIHFMASNFLTSSVVRNLPPDHPIRRLMKPHTYGAVSINMGATTTLATEFSLLHRASAFTWPAVMKGFEASFKMNRFLPILDQLKQNRMSDVRADIYPFGEDTKDFVGIVTSFVGSYIDIYYPTDKAAYSDNHLSAFWHGLRQVKNSGFPTSPSREALTTVLSELIVHVTGIHNQVGNVADYLMDPRFASPKIRPGKEIADVQAAFQGLNIGLMTGNLQPRLLNNFTHLVLTDEHVEATTALFDRLQEDLQDLAATIDRRNERRRFPCNAMNPRTMVSSVSI